MGLKRFTLGVLFARDRIPDFSRELAWKCISEALYAPDTEDAVLYEYSGESAYGCVLTDMPLGRSRRVSRSLSRNLPVIASADWSRPFMLHNEMSHFTGLKRIGEIGKSGEFVPEEGETLSLIFSGPKGKRWINPWKKKRMLLVFPNGDQDAQQIARGIISSAEQKNMDRDILVFTAENGFLPDILLFLNDFRRQRIQAGEDRKINAATCSDGSVILEDVSSEDLKTAAEYFSRLGFHRIVAETDARLDEDVPGVSVEYLDPSDHIRNLFAVYGFSRMAKWCDRIVTVAPGEVPEEAAALLQEAGVKGELFRTPGTAQERNSILSALINK